MGFFIYSNKLILFEKEVNLAFLSFLFSSSIPLLAISLMATNIFCHPTPIVSLYPLA